MAPIRDQQPTPNTKAADTKALSLAQALLDALRIDDRHWHALKSNRRHRAAEQLAAALNQLLHGHDEVALAQLQTAMGWLSGELRDPGCPDH